MITAATRRRTGEGLARLAAVLACILPGIAAAQHRSGKDAPGVAPPTMADVRYGQDAEDSLDIYRPAQPGLGRLIVFLHGGGWRAGSKSLGRFVAPPLVRRGYVVASLGYRLAAPVTPAEETQDAAQGIAYLLRHADQFGIAPGQFAIMGHSSGAHMTALLGVDDRYLRRAGVDPARLAAVVTLDGVFDVTANLTDFPNENRQRPFGDDKAAWKTISPVDLLDGMQAHPRFCLLHEDKKRRFVEQAGLFQGALRKHGETVEEETVPGLGHAQMAHWFAMPDEPIAPFVLDCLGRAFGGAPPPAAPRQAR